MKKYIAFIIIPSLLFCAAGVAQPTASLVVYERTQCLTKPIVNHVFDIEFQIDFTGDEPFDARIRLEDAETGMAVHPYSDNLSVEGWSSSVSEPVCIRRIGFNPFLLENRNIHKLKLTILWFRDGVSDWIPGNPDEAIIVHVHNTPLKPTFDYASIEGCGDTITLKANPDLDETESVFRWRVATGGNGTFTPHNASTTLFAGEPNEGYTVIFTQANGISTQAVDECIADTSINVKLLGSPKGYISTSSEVCGEGDAAITFIVGGNTPFSVNYTNGSEAFTETLPNMKIVNHPVKGETDFWITQITDNLNCIATPDGMGDTITVPDIKPVAFAGDDTDVCGTETALNAAPALEGNTGTWQLHDEDTGEGAFTDVHAANSGFVINDVIDHKTYKLTWTVAVDGKACETADEVNVTFHQIPIAVAGSDAEACGTQITLNAEPPRAGVTGTWLLKEEDTGEGEFSNPHAPNSNLVINNVNDHKTYTLTWSVAVDNVGCETADEVNVTFYEIPIAFAGDDAELCGNQITLNAEPPRAGATGTWQLKDAGANAGGTFTNVHAANSIFTMDDVNNRETCTLTWTVVVDGKECQTTDEVDVTFYEIPIAFAGNDTIIYSSNTTLNARTPTVGEGEWNSNAGIAFFNAKFPQTAANGFPIGETVLGWTVRNGECMSYDEVMITLYGLRCPTGFSPNGDGVNDLFEIVGAHQVNGNRLVIFDKDGQVVYTATDYGHPTGTPFWDGARNGKPVPEGIYSYVFSGKGASTVKKYLIIKR
ncbi:MAG: gliding motility-associated C-terminal domain-containing protein [Cytophagaceae bacterium]|jgi:gliding motility-associated-like protein|nr:gliding motility-associated C-terminal domain-containing protein [Cytophagaceae bacterium]